MEVIVRLEESHLYQCTSVEEHLITHSTSDLSLSWAATLMLCTNSHNAYITLHTKPYNTVFGNQYTNKAFYTIQIKNENIFCLVLYCNMFIVLCGVRKRSQLMTSPVSLGDSPVSSAAIMTEEMERLVITGTELRNTLECGASGQDRRCLIRLIGKV